MNKRFILIFIIIITYYNLSANDKVIDKFSSDLEAYITAYNNEDWKQVTDFLHTGLFTLVPKESVIAGMSQKDDSGVTTKMCKINVSKISKPFNYKDELFYILDYNLYIDFKLDSTLNSQKEMMNSMIISQYGKDNVEVNKDLNQYLVKTEKQMIAISKDNGINFQYLENAKGNDELLKALFDAELIKLIRKNE